MKTKTWIFWLTGVFVLCVCLSVWLFGLRRSVASAEIYQDGTLVRTVSLAQDQHFTVTCGDGYNIITVSGGRIAVTEASCPDQSCCRQGWQSGGAPIVCLPNRLVIKFSDSAGMDAKSG